MLELMEKVILLISLFLCAWIDWKKQEIYLVIPGVAGIIGILFHFIIGSRTIWEVIAGMAMGVLVMFISLLTKESIGYGDAIVFMMTGIYLGLWENVSLFIGTSMLAGVAGLYLIVRKKKNRADRIPMIPFVLISYVLLQLEGV